MFRFYSVFDTNLKGLKFLEKNRNFNIFINPSIGVTMTNLGYGDFTPSFWISRLIISILSLSGIFQTALIVGVLSEALVIPPDEKRILASMEKQREFRKFSVNFRTFLSRKHFKLKVLLKAVTKFDKTRRQR